MTFTVPSSSCCASSVSSALISSVEPLMSANRTVTCLRSPSTALREARIFSARCGGVYCDGAPAPGRCTAAPLRGAAVSWPPHSVQKRLPAPLIWPQLEQASPSRAPQALQNLAVLGLSASQAWHCILGGPFRLSEGCEAASIGRPGLPFNPLAATLERPAAIFPAAFAARPNGRQPPPHPLIKFCTSSQ